MSEEVSHDEQPSPSDVPTLGPVLSKLGSLMSNIMLFTMYSGGIKEDVLFFTPALLALEENEFQDNGFLQFFAQDFSSEEHAKNFEFSDTETNVEFAKRFFSHIAAVESMPDNIRALAAKFAKGFTVRFGRGEVNGFLKPCPLYPLVGAVALVSLMDKEVRGLDMKKLEVVIDFLLKDFDPQAYGIEDEANIYDLTAILGHGFAGDDTPVTLCDGTTARQRSKELLERLANHEAVPENVKQAIADILPSF